MQRQFGSDANLAGIILFSDSTQILNFGSRYLHPIYMCPAGLNYEDMGLKCMTLLGFVPIVPPNIRDTMLEDEKRCYASWLRLKMASIYAHIINQIHDLTKPGITLILQNRRSFHVHPFVLTCVSDHAEGNSIAMLDLLDCRYCTTSPENYVCTENVGSRRVFEIDDRLAIMNPLASDKMQPFDPFWSTHCIFHDIDEGLWEWILNNLVLGLSTFKHADTQTQLSDYFNNLTRVPGFRTFVTVTKESTSYLNARLMRQLLVQLVVIFAGWTFRREAYDCVFVTILTLCQWYEIARSRATTDLDLNKLETLGLRLRKAMQQAAKELSIPYETRAIKHHVILHYPELIKRFGSLLYQSCEMWDSAHKYMIKHHLLSHGSDHYQNVVERRVSYLHFIIALFLFF